MMGRLDPWKGHRDFLGAAARIAARDPAVRFVIAGGTPLGRGDVYRRELRDAVADLGLGDRVFFTGHLDDVAPVLGALRLLVHPSRSPEPFGRSVIEAMSFGVPVVASRAGGVVEIVDEGSNGLLFEPGNVEELAAAVTRLLGDPGTAARMARAARETVVTRFSASGHARRMEDVFLEAIGEARGRRPDAYFARGDQG
jgi:glycosyltransferase involved in cell wall biosynthesis